MTQQSQTPPLQSTARDPQLAVSSQRAKPALWLRVIATASVSSAVITAGVLLAEVAAPQDYHPSSIGALAASNFEKIMIRETVIPKAEAELMIEEARAEGQRNAEILFQTDLKDVELRYQKGLKDIEFEFQRNIAIVQANLQDSLKAYDMLYQRTNMIQQVAYQMEASLMNVKQEAMTKTHGGWNLMTMLGDVGCALSSPEACRLAQEGRQKIANDLVDISRYRSGEVSRDYLQGIQDPAQLRSRLMPNGN
ncbi:hypothetical protein [Litorimonas haliclonae]|uniref:hypothetical protein n=1 Tax=Litorimonas haliclonae TaxID=2081977 RepID=UPI0039F1182D